ncbi:ankyrin repeat and SOCS box protein 13-like isoform X3 [Anneissia japonica]|uniref:ankyrin repeat and SOCS box protein 13-like isoform X3 n=1 Tax=Anneissia japonica TaxID=1529436 RepID=UPI0014255061|nr:ankyrin repeat and SOCS box protein 13-like isoform X3 [Anneissia japonica]
MQMCTDISNSTSSKLNACDIMGAMPLNHAASTGSVECVKLLLESGCDVNPKMTTRSPLHEAALNGSEECVKLLLDAGAELDLQDQHFGTPLHCACDYSNLACARLLLETGSNVNAVVPQTYHTPLHLAAKNKHEKLIRLLMDYGATPFVQDRKHKYPWDLIDEDCDAATTLYQYHSNTVTLKQICRLEIRKHISCSRLDSVDHLAIPDSLRCYLQYK